MPASVRPAAGDCADCCGWGLAFLLHAQASRLFGRIRQTVACQAAPATLKSAFLEPVASQLAAELSVDMFGRKDEDFMGLFTGRWHCGCWGGDDVWLSTGVLVGWHNIGPPQKLVQEGIQLGKSVS